MPYPTTQASWAAWQQAWYDWAALSGITVVWSRDAANPPAPALPFVRLDVLSMTQIGEEGTHDEVAPDGDNIEVTTYSNRRIRLNCQVAAKAKGEFAKNAWAFADELQASLRRDAARDIFREAGLSMQEVGDLTDISAIEQQQFVSRVSFDVQFIGAAVKPAAFTAPRVKRIVGSGDLEGDTTPETTFDVSAP